MKTVLSIFFFLLICQIWGQADSLSKKTKVEIGTNEIELTIGCRPLFGIIQRKTLDNAIQNIESDTLHLVKPKVKETYITKKNSIELIVSELTMGRLGIAYNRNLGKLVNLRVSGSFTLSQYKTFQSKVDIKSFLSLDLQYFPSGHKKASYFTGIRTLLGQRHFYNYQYNQIGKQSSVITEIRNFGLIQMQNGIQFNLNQNMNINALWVAGIILCEEDDLNKELINQLSISLGFKF